MNVRVSEGNLKIALRSLSGWCVGELTFNNAKDCLEFYHGTLDALSNYAIQHNNAFLILVSKNLPEITDDEIIKIVSESNGSRSNTFAGGGEIGLSFLAILSFFAALFGLREFVKKHNLQERLRDLKMDVDKIVSAMENPELEELYLAAKK